MNARTAIVFVAPMITLALALVAGRAQAHPRDPFLPKNSMRIPVDRGHRTGLTEAQFNAVLDRIYVLYRNEVRSHGATFKISRLWTDAEVNAFADRVGDTWMIYMYGGLARHRALTSDGFALVACHEVGHHLGGFPKYRARNDWAANEGQADYYATLKCLRRYFEKDDNEKILASMRVDPVARATCEAEHRGRADQRLCIRGAMAGLSLATLFADLSHDGPIAFTSPDAREVARTDDDHPASQCRLDTYFHGALCTMPVAHALSETDPRPGACWGGPEDPGARPRCWFAP